ncbi:MAG: DUF3825 domain-containing protein [Candidatus Eisenbacteria bacterium]|uniref:DUF3825 domain-containing protein n=1 Tax=Eiseniibacteriota bacterium TaxID=2212470 RepID=A0A849SM85_UNCEI|nr:DUF3825 domain-containing protein [Candidatus Eisenbacteria bacterium]
MTTQEELLEQLGSAYTSKVVPRLHGFAFIPDNLLEGLAREALSEHWGNNHYALEKYLAVHVPWSIEQGRFTQRNNQFYVTAGHLQTRYGTPLYLVFQRLAETGRSPWRLVAAGSRIAAPELPTPPDIPPPPAFDRGAEIVMSHDHILGDNADRVPFLRDTPPVAQMCAVSGAIQWSLNRGLHLGHWYFGQMNYVVPLYLQSRENITRAPDLVAPVQVSPGSLLVRTVLEAQMAYPNARVAVHRHDQLPAWLLEGWVAFADRVVAPEEDLEESESDEV